MKQNCTCKIITESHIKFETLHYNKTINFAEDIKKHTQTKEKKRAAITNHLFQ